MQSCIPLHREVCEPTKFTNTNNQALPLTTSLWLLTCCETLASQSGIQFPAEELLASPTPRFPRYSVRLLQRGLSEIVFQNSKQIARDASIWASSILRAGETGGAASVSWSVFACTEADAPHTLLARYTLHFRHGYAHASNTTRLLHCLTPL